MICTILFFFKLFFFFCLLLLFSSFFAFLYRLKTSLTSSTTGYLARLNPMVISVSQHPRKVDYRIPKYIIQLWVNKILVVVVVVVE